MKTTHTHREPRTAGAGLRLSVFVRNYGRGARRSLLVGVSLLFLLLWAQIPAPSHSAESPWLRPRNPNDALIWGRKDGLIFGLSSPGGLEGPRGLIRVGIVGKSTGKPEL